MADIWQWKGDATTGAGYVVFTGTATVAISGSITAVVSGTATVAVSGTATVAIDQTTPGTTNAVQPIGDFVVQVSVATSATVTAGAQTAIGSAHGTAKADTIVVAVDGSDIHTWSSELSWLNSSGTNIFQDSAGSIIASGSRRRANSGRVSVLAPKAQLYVTNGATSDKTYLVNLYALGVKAI